MKNILLIGFIAVFALMNGQLTAQECTVHAGPTGASPDTYRAEIADRLSSNNHPWLMWDALGKEGGFNCDALLTTIKAQLTDGNFVILDDTDYYHAGGRENDINFALGTVRNRSHWPKAYFDYPVASAGHDPSKKFFLLTPGDYRDYENLFLYNGGTADQKKYILYYDGPTNGSVDAQAIIDYFEASLCANAYDPVNRPDNKQALIERFYIKAGSDSYPSEGHWVIGGITVRGNHYSYPDVSGETQSGGMVNQILGSNNVLWSCLFQNITGASAGTRADGTVVSYGANFIQMNNTDNNIIANCTFKDKNECVDATDPNVDMIGIFLKGNTATSSNNIIIGNYMTGVGDAIQLMPSSNNDATTMGAPGTLIYNNRLYNEKFYNVPLDASGTCFVERMNGEGAIDLKMGAGPWGCNTAPLPQAEKVIIANNVIHGWRGGIAGGGNGDAIHMHSNSKNIVVIDNEISDCTTGISVGGNITNANDDSKPTRSVEHIEVYDNKICNLYPSVSQYTSSCFSSDDTPVVSKAISVGTGSARIVGNSIKDAVHGLLITGRGDQAVITDNYLNGTYEERFSGRDLDDDNFARNTYINFHTVCVGSDDYGPEDFLQRNCFLCPDGSRITSNICEAACLPE